MNALLGLENLLTDDNMIASDELPGFEVQNAIDTVTSSHWRTGSDNQHTITIDMGAQVTCDYWAIASHTLARQSATIILETSPNGSTGWEPVDDDPEWEPEKNLAYMRTFEPVTAQFWRFTVKPVGVGQVVASIGVLQLGAVLELPAGIMPGYSPPHLARTKINFNQTTENGQFLGRAIIQTGIKGIIKQDLITAQWIYENWPAILEHIERRPFFYNWLPDFETAVYCWTVGDIPAPEFIDTIYMAFSFNINGLP